MSVIDANCPHCAKPLWIEVNIEAAEERPKEPEPWTLSPFVETFIFEAIDLQKLTYSNTGRLLNALQIQPPPGKSWHAHTLRAIHRHALERREAMYLNRQIGET